MHEFIDLASSHKSQFKVEFLKIKRNDVLLYQCMKGQRFEEDIIKCGLFFGINYILRYSYPLGSE